MLDITTLHDDAREFFEEHTNLIPVKKITINDLKVNDEVFHSRAEWAFKVLAVESDEEEYNHVTYKVKRIKFKIIDYPGYIKHFDLTDDDEDDDLYEESFDSEEINNEAILLHRSNLDTRIFNFKKILALTGVFAVTLVGLGLISKDK